MLGQTTCRNVYRLARGGKRLVVPGSVIRPSWTQTVTHRSPKECLGCILSAAARRWSRKELLPDRASSDAGERRGWIVVAGRMIYGREGVV